MSNPATEHPLATKGGLEIVLALLMHTGAMCRCGHGTRATSKRWAKCKKCGARVERREIKEADNDHSLRTIAWELLSEHEKRLFPRPERKRNEIQKTTVGTDR